MGAFHQSWGLATAIGGFFRVQNNYNILFCTFLIVSTSTLKFSLILAFLWKIAFCNPLPNEYISAFFPSYKQQNSPTFFFRQKLFTIKKVITLMLITFYELPLYFTAVLLSPDKLAAVVRRIFLILLSEGFKFLTEAFVLFS